MASRVLLISTNRLDQPYPVFPLGLAHLETALRQAGHVTRLLDLQLSAPPLADALAEFDPAVVGLSLRNIDDLQIENRRTFFDELATLCQQVRAAGPCPVILGGSGFSIFPGRLLELSGADFGIRGEGERSLLRLLAALENGGDWQAIPGLVFRRERQIVINPRQEMPAAAIPAALRSPEAAAYYLRRSAMLNVQTQRGCDWNCCYCAYPLIEGRHPRRRPPDAVAAELATLQQQGVRYVFIVDSVFNTSADHVNGICEAMLRHDVKLQWGCFLRPQGLTADLMRLMARSGLSHIEFGSDSFCDSVLAAYGKQFTFDDVRHSADLAQREKVHHCHFLVCGGPGETRATLETTFANSQRLKGAVICGLVGMRIYPGTPLCQRARREGRVTADADLLRPIYYIAAGLTEQEIAAKLQEFKQKSPNWLVGSTPPSLALLAERLRTRGVLGPLWPYFELIQRLN